MSLIVVIRNISALAPTSDYEVQVRINDQVTETLIVRHRRSDGWKRLLQLVVEKLEV